MSIQPALLCRFTAPSHEDVRVGLVDAGFVRDLTAAGVNRLDDLLEHADLACIIREGADFGLRV